MEDTQLTTEEKVEIKERWFLIRDIITYPIFLSGFFKLLWLLLLWIVLMTLIWGITTEIVKSTGGDPYVVSNIIETIILCFMFWIWAYYMFGVLVYALLWRVFIIDTGIIAYTKKYQSISEIPLLNRITRLISPGAGKYSIGKGKWIFLYFPVIIFIMMILSTGGYKGDMLIFIIFKISVVLSLFIIPLLPIIIRQIVNTFHPTYAFGNIWEKIQKLTPQISEKSQEIQKNFASDMNYGALSDGFDGLASTFSQIVSLVIRLEKVEARANKGNLFDSERYISSLRSDIVWPLRSLRGFLDSKRTALTASQQELSRVRVQVGGASENRDLASARTEPLMRELTENIDALDMMIEKMG